jgi:hypothetical protein
MVARLFQSTIFDIDSFHCDVSVWIQTSSLILAESELLSTKLNNVAKTHTSLVWLATKTGLTYCVEAAP